MKANALQLGDVADIIALNMTNINKTFDIYRTF